MKTQAIKINSWGKNVYVKVPVANSKGKFMGRIIKELNNQNIKLNITAVYNAKQTENILKLINKKTKVIISIFAGRAGDTGNYKKDRKLWKIIQSTDKRNSQSFLD
jgi:transaldolase